MRNRLIDCLSIHPATRLVLWFFFLGITHCLRGVALALILVLFPLFGRDSLKHGFFLVWRARWFLLPVFLVPAWNSAGKPLWEAGYAPTYEGLNEAFTHLGRLLLILMSVGVLLEKLPLPAFLSASRFLFKPLEYFGIDAAQRGLIRLLLALHYAGDAQHPVDWQNLLKDSVPAGKEWVEIQDVPLRWFDWPLIFSGALLFVAVLHFR
ncbi:MAG: energy-coupling factor transporter transmembrane protein EcfT [Candidatus Accumulibacter sp.]|jgi:hypothetical protein|nr:energy-coupling factor transporter transmembrane protein EcfT [Accumulibacter sp.]